jgi:hypothetical protein
LLLYGYIVGNGEGVNSPEWGVNCGGQGIHRFCVVCAG